MSGMLVLVLAGCGGGGASSGVARQAPAPTVRSEREAPAPPSRVRGRPRGAARPCGPTDLVVSHTGLGNGALSHYYTAFDLTNISPHACRISGFPRIAELGVDGRQVGRLATRGTPSPERGRRTVTIAKGRGAVFRASWEENVYAAGKCRPRTITRFRVVLPGSHLAQVVPYPVFERCTSPVAQESFSVSRIEPSRERGFHPEQPRVRSARVSERLPRCREGDLLAWVGPDHPGASAPGPATPGST